MDGKNYIVKKKYCKNCGALLNEGEELCSFCGVYVGSGNRYCEKCGAERRNKAAKDDDMKKLIRLTAGQQ